MLQLPTASLCFAVIGTLLLIGTSQGTYAPPQTLRCCENSTPINGRCVCKPNYYGDSTHKCVRK
ncbi:hypothetical protein KP79_PYT19233 [Mizuhopecten yessoensis]|uniref:EGF-like domain-containing protein n=1 Tax=Mizuhopecten yessoensis TaxID=6573 RepID=A0A210R5G4_MIZYE|nr:hypothetical protein KP79_PYT19233 [Mizuhopecten yessoensis]